VSYYDMSSDFEGFRTHVVAVVGPGARNGVRTLQTFSALVVHPGTYYTYYIGLIRTRKAVMRSERGFGLCASGACRF
jgi:hypothetical protein